MDDALTEALLQDDYAAALARATELSFDPASEFVAKLRFLQTKEPSPDLLSGISDTQWICNAVLDRLVEDVDLEKRLLECGLKATELDAPRLLKERRQLLQLQDRLRTYAELYASAQQTEEEEDAWDLEEEPVASSSAVPAPSLITFLRTPLLDLALTMASEGDERALRIILLRHGDKVDAAQRMQIAEALPLHTEALEYLDFIPSPKAPTRTTPWRDSEDWSEAQIGEQPAELSESLLSKAMIDRIETVESSTGLVELALSLVQHAAARGITGLESLGEELSLLSSLVYDRPEPPDGEAVEHWSLARWRDASPEILVRALLAHSSEDTIVDDIQRLLRPFLFVLEARCERAGKPDPQLPTSLLYDFILSAPLQLVKAIISASKPTLPVSRRVIKDEADLARLALACLYGNDSVEEWIIMNAIFECQPAFAAATEWDGALQQILTSDATAKTIFAGLRQVPPAGLTKFLDALDVHLDSGETLARWNAPRPLRWLVIASGNELEQRQWCLRLIRKGGAQAESEDEWVALLEDAARLAAPEAAFDALTKDEVTKIFFETLLGAGSFSLAKSLLNPSSGERPLEPLEVQELVLKTSRELYDNATSGNLHVGDMKLALECLAVAPPSPIIRRERDFIEATSRLCSFNLPDQPAPIQIRQATDKLPLVNWVIDHHNDAFRHPDMIIDLVGKLVGEMSPAIEVRTLGMIVRAALRKKDFPFAAELCERMVGAMSRAKDAGVAEVVWRCCAEVGMSAEYSDLDRRMRLLGRAMLLAPEDEVSKTLLPAWRTVEAAPRAATSPNAPLSEAARNVEDAARAAVSLGKVATAYLRASHAQEPAKVGHPPPAAAPHGLGADDHHFDVRGAMSKRFTQGVGWLIGADASELDG